MAFPQPPEVDANRNLRPFLRWPGGKAWLLRHIKPIMGEVRNKYIEPFLGGGSLFFGFNPVEAAILSDINKDLIECYQQVAQAPEEIWQHFCLLRQGHSHQQYDSIRKQVAPTATERAARFIYLNKTSFNGLYRVNRQGQFNVPMGTARLESISCESLKACASALQSAKITVSDFEPQMRMASSGDTLVLDPPYTVAHNQNGFVRYNEAIFSWADQERLAIAAHSAADRGARVFIMNAHHPDVSALYDLTIFDISVHSRYSAVSATASGRSRYQELLIQSKSPGGA